MKTILASNAIRNTVFSVLLLMPMQMHLTLATPEYTELSSDGTTSVMEELPPSASPKIVLLSLDNDEEVNITEKFINDNMSTIEFMSKTFGIDSSHIIEDLISINDKYEFNDKNIGLLTNKKGELKEFKSFEEGLIEYLFNYSKEHKDLVSKKRTPYTGGSNYIIDLIKYYTSIYDNVDYLTAVSIGAAESGHYKVKSMLKYNNVYGGMSSKGLIKYNNIEYGVLSYIRTLSKNYYGKGLTTLESIGRVYCPTYNESGQKVASSHWLNLVRSAKKKYANSYSVITIDDLINTNNND